MRFLFLFCFGIFFILLSNESLAQTSRESEANPASSQSQIFQSKKKASKKSYNKKNDQGIKEYEALMKANKKKYRKREKGMKKPQYSDPSYFGHKKKPKKRPLKKRKFCEECGIVH
ncbi:hypothetical protein N7E81_18065 [Reichenbachiella carrageenanivorans]|uniref:Uncharacterized protein n=1 Tax=Reichenbachiella carrageenanivorans TaxID=2979869 RepID=A0ABY6CZC3_9BACT|nr:hypothetical protein [Reichenbachiella carrageenanivorans]UXX79262.1 hypothetical protein N7E81_18065 [Reichenbachiella carrageenanivorans]